MTEHKTALNKLKSYGELVGQFNQALYAEKLLEQKNIKGYCVGVCMDCMRRILQGAKGSLLPEKDQRPRLKQTAARGFEAYTVTGSLLAESKATFADRNALFIRVGKATRELHTISTTAKDSYNLPSFIQQTLKLINVPVKATISRKELEDAFKKASEFENTFEKFIEGEAGKRKAIPPAALLWGGIVAKMDPFHTGMNSENGRDQTRRPYAGIKPVAGAAGFLECSTLALAVNSAIEKACFTEGRGMILEVLTGTGRSEAGHAHGLYKEGDDLYLFLDPNFGVFRYSKARVS
jgi:hypothetical protein